VEDVASPEGFRRDPALVWRFYSQRRAQCALCVPNAAHKALAALGETLGDRLFLCTQNVDPLHELAGSRDILHMHGELFKSRCTRCEQPNFEDRGVYASLEAIPRCACGSMIRPHIVWFGEVPFELDRIAEALASCTVFVTIGSSGVVYPAAGFVREIQSRSDASRVRTVYVGLESPDNARAFKDTRLGKAGDVVPTLFETF
jgi:NAD-dependent deacetylase